MTAIPPDAITVIRGVIATTLYDLGDSVVLPDSARDELASRIGNAAAPLIAAAERARILQHFADMPFNAGVCPRWACKQIDLLGEPS